MTHGTGFHIVYHMILFIQSDAHISGAIPCIPCCCCCCCCCCCYWHECVYMSPLLLRSFPLIFQNPIAPNIQPRNMNSNAYGCHLLNELSIRHQNSTSNRFFLKTSFFNLFFHFCCLSDSLAIVSGWFRCPPMLIFIGLFWTYI